MRHLYAVILALVSPTLTAPVDGSKEDPGNQDAPKGVLKLPLIPIPPASSNAQEKIKRRQVQDDLDAYRFLGTRPAASFGMPFEIGTPPQTVLVEPDTGSDRFWVPGVVAGKARVEPSSVYFDQDRSTSKRPLNRQEALSYGQREMIALNMCADQVSISGNELGEMEFGVGDMRNTTTALGRVVGLVGLRQPDDQDPEAQQFIMQKLLDKKLITYRSLGMNVDEKGHGAITFGGYDTKKFSGPLEKLPFSNGASNDYVVAMQSISFSNGSLDQTLAGPTLTIGIDSGSPALMMRQAARDKLQAALGADKHGQVLKMSCGKLQNATVTLKMNDKLSIPIPLKDFQMVSSKLRGQGKCLAAVGVNDFLPADAWIGAHFLRRAYTLFDIQNKNVYIARGGNCGSNVVAIDKGIPDGVTEKRAPECMTLVYDIAAAYDQIGVADNELDLNMVRYGRPTRIAVKPHTMSTDFVNLISARFRCAQLRPSGNGDLP